jgi:MerR family transcriptional regulator, light-induced transcriptional regulator
VSASSHVRIGELGRRVGVSTELLRAWERRYGLLRPARSAGGFRLYDRQDEDRVRLMQDHLAQGLSAAEAASLALAGERPRSDASTAGRSPTAALERLGTALDAFDELEAQAVMDDLLSDFTLDTILRDVLLPYLRELGERWERGDVSVAQEHYASGLLRGRLLGLARGWGRGIGPHALLAGAPGEQHDLGLISFGLSVRARGWRVTFLGQDTPIADIAATARAIRPDLVVVTATTRRRLSAVADELAALGKGFPLAVAGAGADAAIAERVGGLLLEGDPVSAADALVPA